MSTGGGWIQDERFGSKRWSASLYSITSILESRHRLIQPNHHRWGVGFDKNGRLSFNTSSISDNFCVNFYILARRKQSKLRDSIKAIPVGNRQKFQTTPSLVIFQQQN